MELEELVGKIVDQSKDKRLAGGGVVRETVINTLMADIEDWAAWYVPLFDGEYRVDLSRKRPSSLQQLNIKTLERVVREYVEEYALELKAKKKITVNVDDACRAIAERVTYWEDWYWEFSDYVEDVAESEEMQAYEAAYFSDYGEGMDERPSSGT